jgi:hypothetical protein
MSYLNLQDLQKFQLSRENKQYDYFEEVLKKCHHKIRVSASNFEVQCFFSVPKFILGLPSYSQKMCCEYVMNRLIHDGLKVLFINPNILYIIWDTSVAKTKKISTTKMINKDNHKDKPKQFEYRPISSIIPTNNLIYDSKVLDVLKNKTENFAKY